jgi:parallel beta-helix repeat protein
MDEEKEELRVGDNKSKLMISSIVGIIAVVLIALIVLSVIYFTGNNVSPANLTNNETGINLPDNNSPAPNATGINGTTPATNKTTNKTTTPSGGSSGGGVTNPPSTCTDTCFSLGYSCGNRSICGVVVNCGECIASCINDTGCSSSGSFCDVANNMPYACLFPAGGDGCLDRLNGTSCSGGEICDSGICKEVHAIFVDNQLTTDCNGTYSIANRNCNGSEGIAFNTIQKGVDNATAGTTVIIRNGEYYLNDISPVTIANKNGTVDAKITIENYGSEEVIIDATNVKGVSGTYYGFYVSHSNYLTLNGLTIKNSPGYGVRVYKSNYVEILNCTVHSNKGIGIYYRDSSYALISNC